MLLKVFMNSYLMWCGVWCGVVCGVVWCGVVCGVVWCGVVWCGVWWGMVWLPVRRVRGEALPYLLGFRYPMMEAFSTRRCL